MDSFEASGSFFPSIKLKTFKQSSSSKIINNESDHKLSFSNNKSELDISNLIKGYYDGYYKYKKKVKPITVSINLESS